MYYNKISNKPFLLFLPFLILYIIIIVLFPTDATFGDESRYIIYAKFMVDGHLPFGEANFEILGNGPGYSILLIPFVALKLPLITITLMNGVLYYFSIILLFQTVKQFASLKKTICICVFFGLYINLYESFVKILPETFVSFLICLLLYYMVKAFRSHQFNKYIIFSGIIMGLIALTKPVFGYVLTVTLTACILLWLYKRSDNARKKILLVLLIAFGTTLPYLAFTYSTTGKVLYWSSFGGTSLYWMTSPNEKEYGSWFQDIKGENQLIDSASALHLVKGYRQSIEADHQSDFQIINKYKGVQQDSVFKSLAIKNIRNYPLKFIKNCLSNAGRIVFNFPYSYKLQNPHTLIRLPFNGIIVVLIIFSIFPALRNWKKIDFFMRFFLFFTLIYLGGSLFGSAETRMFTIIVPILLFWIGYIFEKIFMINLKFEE